MESGGDRGPSDPKRSGSPTPRSIGRSGDVSAPVQAVAPAEVCRNLVANKNNSAEGRSRGKPTLVGLGRMWVSLGTTTAWEAQGVSCGNGRRSSISCVGI